MAKSEQVIKDLDRVIGLINTDMKDIPAEEKKTDGSRYHRSF